MGGFFGVTSEDNCVNDLFFGTDYQSHLGTQRGGLATLDKAEFTRFIHDISNTQFRSKFDDDIKKMSGKYGIGVISDYEDQPILVSSHLGQYAIVTVGVIQNADELVAKAFKKKHTHFAEVGGGYVNPTEIVATMINEEDSFEAGIERAHESIEGSCSILVLTNQGIYAGRDRMGRTPIIIGKKDGAYCAAQKTAHSRIWIMKSRKNLALARLF